MKVAVVFFHIVLIFTIAYLLAKRWGEIKSKLFWSAFICHLAAAMAMGLIYKYYYTADDTWFFFDTASKFADLAKQDFLFYLDRLFDFSWDQGPYIPTRDFRTVIFIKMISVLCLVADNNYWVCSAYFSLLGFGASWFLFRKINLYFSQAKEPATIAFLFFPSVVFWSSGIVKETLALASLYFLAGIFLQIFYDRKIDRLAFLLVLSASVIVWTLKYYWAGVFFIAVISVFTVAQLSSRFPKVKKGTVISYILSFILIGIAVSFLHPNFYLDRFLAVMVANHNEFVRLSNDSSLIHYHELNATYKSVIINSPWALFSGIFRPFVGEGHGTIGLFASVENLLVLVLLVSFLWRFRTPTHQHIDILALAVISYCIVLCVFLALSTPNLGTLSRYRVGFMPFLIFLLAYRNPLLDKVTKKFSN